MTDGDLYVSGKCHNICDQDPNCIGYSVSKATAASAFGTCRTVAAKVQFTTLAPLTGAYMVYYTSEIIKNISHAQDYENT